MEGCLKRNVAPKPFSQGPPLKGPHQLACAAKVGPSEYIRARSVCNDLRTLRSTVRRGDRGFFDRSTIPVTVEEEGDEEGGGEEVSSSHLISDRHHFSVADPIGASINHDGEYSFGFLSWLARDLGASIDYAKSRLKSSFRPRGSSTFCLVKPEICTSPQTAIDYHVRRIKRVVSCPKTKNVYFVDVKEVHSLKDTHRRLL